VNPSTIDSTTSKKPFVFNKRRSRAFLSNYEKVTNTPYTSSSSTVAAPAPGSAAPVKTTNITTSSSLVDNTDDLIDDPTIEWTEGYENLRTKKQDNNNNNNHDDDDETNEEADYYLPENAKELNIEVLASLPTEMRKQIIEELRRKERMKSRSTYIPVADNPSLYSQTQLSNFLKTSQLNRKFQKVQKALEVEKAEGDLNIIEGRTIASQGDKRYRFLQLNENRNNWDEGKDNHNTDIPMEEEDWQQKQEEEQDGMGGGFLTSPLTGKRKLAEDEELEKRKKFLRLLKGSTATTAPPNSSGNTDRREMVLSQPALEVLDLEEDEDEEETQPLIFSDELDKRNEMKEGNKESTKINDENEDDRNDTSFGGGFLLEDDETEVEEEGEASVHHIIQDEKNHLLSLTASKPYQEYSPMKPEESVKEEDKHFYDNLHDNDDEEEDQNGFDDVEWETEEVQVVEDEQTDRSSPVDLTESYEDNDDNDPVIQEILSSSLKPVKSVHFTDLTHSDPSITGDFMLDYSMTSAQNNNNHNSNDNNNSTLNRAIATASSMADWAGRVVRKVLKEHIVKEKEGQGPGSGQKPIIDLTSNINAHSNSTIDTNSIEYILKKSPSEKKSPREADHSVISDLPPFVVHSAKSGGEVWNKITERLPSEDEMNDEDEKISMTSPQKNGTMAFDLLQANNEQTYSHQTTEEYHQLRENNNNYILENDNDNMSEGEMEELKKTIVNSNRDTEKITEEMKEQVMELIKAFDLPYIIAPYEAEAQCCILEQLGLVDGIITEDSDAFLFGGSAIYKNIFSDKKYVEVYLSNDAEKELGLKREDFIVLAYFLGSDYTEGVHGIGIVNAMEIIQAFSSSGKKNKDDDEDEDQDDDDDSLEKILAPLNKFKEWLNGYDFTTEIVNEMKEKEKRRKKRKQKTVNNNSNNKEEDPVIEEIKQEEEEEEDLPEEELIQKKRKEHLVVFVFRNPS
jgi:DNA excision repair protein ERCC-5